MAQPERLEVSRHDPKIIEELSTAPIYKKQGEVKALIAQGGEVIVTKLADGSTETTNTANPGDAIVTNPGGEQYIVQASTFERRYETKIGPDGTPEAGTYSARGYIRAINNPFASRIAMMAEWGQMQEGDEDAKIADIYDDKTGTLAGQPYIIGKEEFGQTYKPTEQ
jgi:hypothetical protein